MNYYLDKKQILNIASNHDVYNKGNKYYEGGRITKIDFFNSANTYTVSAQVKGELKTYTTTANFDDEGILKNYKCTCNSNGIWRGACKHVVAVLLKIFDMNRQKAIVSKDLRASKKMLDIFEKQAYEEIDTILNEVSAQNNKVGLIPKLSLDDKCNPFLTFTIGRDRKYILKNVSEFIDNINEEKIVKYGKNLEFQHKLSMFDKQSIELIKIMMKELENSANFVGKASSNSFYYASIMDNKTLFLSYRGIDSVFDVFEDDEIELDILDFEEETIQLITGEPELKFDIKLSEQEECLELVSNTSKVIGLRGEKFNYIMHEGIMYRTGDEFYNTIYPIINAFSGVKQNTILISKQEISRFMTFLYPRLKENNLLGENTNIYELDVEYFHLNKKIYFDVGEKKGITCKVLFCYGELDINPIIDDMDKSNRNILEEYKLLQKLAIFGFVADEKKQLYTMHDENLMYDFYYSPNGLDMIREQNEVYATNEFMKKSIKPKGVTAFGIKLNGDLLEIDVDTKDYDVKELMNIISAYNQKKKFYRLKDGTFLSLDDRNKNIEVTAKLISGLGIKDKDVIDGKIQVPKYRALYLDNLIKENDEIEATIDDEVTKVASDFKLYKDLSFKVPQELDDILRPYQKEGYNWLKIISHYNFGGILADDMGLGKTLQVITVLLSEKGRAKKPSIVVAPTSLIYNWEKEITRFAQGLNVLIVAGASARRQEMLKDSTGIDVYITTYDMLKRDIKAYEDMEFEYIIADEAQNIKNPATQNAKALKQLRGRVRYALTGTPIENSLIELWSIFDFIMQGYLYNNAKFIKHYEVPIIKDNDEKKSEELRRHISPFILRRVKKDVLNDLPEKIETTLYADMTTEQHKVYTAHLLQAKGEFENSLRNGEFNKNRIDVLAQLTRLRQICCHPSVFIENYKGGSGKLDLTIETIVSSIESGHRILVFSQFTSMLSILEENLKKHNVEYFYLDGATESKQRIIMTDRFNNGERDVFLISLKAGGTGLNLTGADIVIHFDPWWNPAVMDQASDRAHRFGQKKTVQVINVVAKDSIEEKIMKLQAKKKDLVDNVIKEGANFINRMSEEDVIGLFKE